MQPTVAQAIQTMKAEKKKSSPSRPSKSLYYCKGLSKHWRYTIIANFDDAKNPYTVECMQLSKGRQNRLYAISDIFITGVIESLGKKKKQNIERVTASNLILGLTNEK